MKILETLNWRYATKKYLKQPVTEENITTILEAIRLSASSAGVQPYKVIVINNEELKNKLQAASFNPQVSECSHLLVFAAYDKVTQEHLDEYISNIANERGVPVESLDAFKTRMQGNLLPLTNEQAFNWAARQAYIGLGTGLVAAASLKVDSSPMEGFDGAKFDEILELKNRGLKSVVLLALGYRDEEKDFLAKQKKVRMPLKDLTIKLY